MINDIFTGVVSFFTSLVETGSTAADGFLNTGSTAAEDVAGTVVGSVGNIVGSL